MMKEELTPYADISRFELTRNIEYTPVTHKTSLQCVIYFSKAQEWPLTWWTTFVRVKDVDYNNERVALTLSKLIN